MNGLIPLHHDPVECDHVVGSDPLVHFDDDLRNQAFDLDELQPNTVRQRGLGILEPELVGPARGEELPGLPLRAREVGEDRRAGDELVRVFEVLERLLPVLRPRGLESRTELAPRFGFLFLGGARSRVREEDQAEGQMKDEPAHRRGAYRKPRTLEAPIRGLLPRGAFSRYSRLAMKVGESIAGYDIVAKLKSGGMAALYLGRRSRAGFEKHVAIKIVHEHLSEDPAFAQMFLDEARISALIEHPNVVHVHDLGIADGRDFLVMEYVPGVSLSQLMRSLTHISRRPSPEICVHIAMQIASGLQAAHDLTDEEGKHLEVVHRDVSPKNVLIAFRGYVKLIDFGIAKAAGRTQQTQGGLLKGTFRYMSPEQAAGKHVDARSDIYALGIVLWELLTMRRLYDADNDLRLLDIVRDPSPMAPSSVVHGLDPELDRLVLWALAKDPAARPQSAAEFRRALGEAYPGALSVTHRQLAELVGAALEGTVEPHEDPSVRSALGAPMPAPPDALDRLTRPPSRPPSRRGFEGAAVLEAEAAPTLMTPSQISGIALRPPPFPAMLQGDAFGEASSPGGSLPAPSRPSMAKWVIGGAMVTIGLAVGVGMAMRTKSEVSSHPLAPESAPEEPSTLVAPVVEPVAVTPTEALPSEPAPVPPPQAEEPPAAARVESEDEPNERVRPTMRPTPHGSATERDRPQRDSDMSPLLIDEF